MLSLLEKQAREIVLYPYQTAIYGIKKTLRDLGTKLFHICAHRRAGKSMSFSASCQRLATETLAETDIFKLRGEIKSDNPQYAFLAETKEHARSIIWTDLKNRFSVFKEVDFNEKQLIITIPRPKIGDEFKLMLKSLRDHNSCRGMKFRGIFLDEAQLLQHQAYNESIYSTVTDSGGFIVTSGTARPDGYYREMLVNSISEFRNVMLVPVTITNVFSKEEQKQMLKNMGEVAFNQEYLCDFNAPTKGAFWADQLSALEKNPDFFSARHDPSLPTVLSVDIGFADNFVVWVWQLQGNCMCLLDYFYGYETGIDLKYDLDEAGYTIDRVIIPHDGKNRKVGTYRPISTAEMFKETFPRIPYPYVVDRPKSKAAVIAYTSNNLKHVRFPHRLAASEAHNGLIFLKNYRARVTKEGFVTDAIDKTYGYDHCADAFMTGMLYLDYMSGEPRRRPSPSFNHQLTMRAPTGLSKYSRFVRHQRPEIDRKGGYL